MVMRVSHICLPLLLALAGCVSTPIHVASDLQTKAMPGSNSPGKATIYVYRAPSGAGAMWPFAVLVDDREVGSIRNERYIAANVAPGTHVVKVHCKGMCDLPDIAVQGDFNADQSYHFLTAADIRFGWAQSAFTSTLLQVDPANVAELQRTYAADKSADAGG